MEFLLGLVAAVGIGGLVGIEREHRRDSAKVYAGVRTFPLISTAGFLVALLTQELDAQWVLAAGTFTAGLFAIAFFYVRSVVGEVGFTTPMAIMVTFLAGALIGIGMLLEATVVAVVTTFLLLTKERLHNLAETLDADEVMGAIQFVALAFVAFPLAAAADGPYLQGLVGQGRAIDLRWTLFVVVAASSLAFISFLALRQLGSRYGMTATGALGGLVNSEAATASAGSLARGARGLDNAASAAVLAATATMLVRNVVLAAFADPSFSFVLDLAIVLAVPAAVVTIATYIIGRRAPALDEAPQLELDSPFAIKPALVFALVFTVVNAFVFFAQGLLGPWGVYATSIGALVSSGAVVASAANLVFTGTISPTVGLITAALASAISILAKLVVLSITNRALIGRVLVPVLLGAAATGLGLVIVL